MLQFFTVHAQVNKLDVSGTWPSSIDSIVRVFVFLCTKRMSKLRCIKSIIKFLMKLIPARFQFCCKDIILIFKNLCKIIIQ